MEKLSPLIPMIIQICKWVVIVYLITVLMICLWFWWETHKTKGGQRNDSKKET